VICETEVNKAKKAFTGYQFILNSQGTRKLNVPHMAMKKLQYYRLKLIKISKDNFTDKKNKKYY